MTKWKAFGMTLLATAGMSSRLLAQAVPIAPPPAAVIPVAPAAPIAAEPMTIWSLLGLSKDQLKKCKAEFCQKPISKIFNAASMQFSQMSGGLIGPCCPEVPRNPIEQAILDANKSDTEKVADAIKKEEANAKARRAAVRYLGTVDCHYWPEAEEALINALREDRNECVRWEAAMALGNGCCCTKSTINALMHSVLCSDKDRHPVETSERVKVASYMALQHCLDCYREITPAPPAAPVVPRPEGPTSPPVPRPETRTQAESTSQRLVPGATPAAAYKAQLAATPMAEIVGQARRAVAEFKSTLPPGSGAPDAGQGLVQLVSSSFATGTATPAEHGEAAVVVVKEEPVIKTASFQAEKHSESKRGSLARVFMPVPAAMASSGKPAPGAEQTAPGAEQATTVRVLHGRTPSSTTPAPVVQHEQAPVVTPVVHQVPATPVAQEQPMLPAPSDVHEQPAAPVMPAPVVSPVSAPTPMSALPVSQPPVMSAPVVRTPLAPVDTPAAAPSTQGSVSRPPAVTTNPVAPTSRVDVPRMLGVLQTSSNPFQREWAVEILATADWRVSPEVSQAVVKAAREDNAATVRAACARGLLTQNINTPEVVGLMRALQNDKDPRVQQAATRALARFESPTGSSTPATPFNGRAN